MVLGDVWYAACTATNYYLVILRHFSSNIRLEHHVGADVVGDHPDCSASLRRAALVAFDGVRQRDLRPVPCPVPHLDTDVSDWSLSSAAMRAPGPLLEANWIASSKFRITLAAFLTLPTVASRVPPVFQQIVHQKYHVIHHTTNSKIQCNYSSVKIQSGKFIVHSYSLYKESLLLKDRLLQIANRTCCTYACHFSPTAEVYRAYRPSIPLIGEKTSKKFPCFPRSIDQLITSLSRARNERQARPPNSQSNLEPPVSPLQSGIFSSRWLPHALGP